MLPLLYEVAKRVFILLDILSAAVLIFAIAQGVKFRPDLNPRRRSLHKRLTLSGLVFRSQWEDIERKFHSGDPELQRLALLDADALAEDACKKLGVQGDTMIERIRELRRLGFFTGERLERAHRVRNEIVHSPDYALAPEIAEQSFEDYDAFLKEVTAEESPLEEEEHHPH